MRGLQFRTIFPVMSDNDTGGDPLYAALAALTGRRLTMAEVYAAVGLSKARYYEARQEGTLARPDRLIVAAHHLGINPIELLIECHPAVTVRDAMAFVEKKVAQAREIADYLEPRPLSVVTTGRGTATAKRADVLTIRPDSPPL